MFSLAKFGRRSLVTASIIAMSCGVTYYVSEQSKESYIANLEAQIDSLNYKIMQARVTQRISEQMEDIASQESQISSRERDRAEKQSLIADSERKKAEFERGLALKAQNQAIASAQEAKKAQAVAEEESKRATEFMNIAVRAKQHTDTLVYKSIINSLAQSSISQEASGKDNNLASLLAYTAWDFNEKYVKDDSKMSNIYNALLQSSDAMEYLTIMIKGNIRKIHILKDAMFAVSDYGEVLYGRNGLYSVSSASIGTYDFRDLYSFEKDRNVALTSDGKLVLYDLTDIEKKSVKTIPHKVILQLPQTGGVWKRIGEVEGRNTLIAIADNMVAWIDAKTLTLLNVANTDTKTTALGKQGNVNHIFCKNGVHYVTSETGKLVRKDLNTLKSDDVTSYIYDKTRKLQYMGLSSGEILVYDDNYKKQSELMGHTGPITELHVWNKMLGSTSFDATMCLWNVSDFNSMIIPVAINFMHWPLSFDIDKKTETVYVATEKGFVSVINTNLKKIAEKTRENINRDFTPEEWNYYVGKDIPRQTYKK